MAYKKPFFPDFFLLCKKTFFEVWLPDHPNTPKTNWLHWLAVFIGIPNRTPKDVMGSYQPQTAWNLFKKFFGWQDQRKLMLGKTIRNLFIGILFLAPINLITIAIQTPISILKIFSEFLPRLITNAIELKIKKLNKNTTGKNWYKYLQDRAAAFVLGIVAIPFYLLHFVSRSFTTPVKGFKKAFDSGKRGGKYEARSLAHYLRMRGHKNVSKFFKNHAAKIAMLFALTNSFLSIFCTVLTWSFALPLILKSAGIWLTNHIAQQGIANRVAGVASDILFGLATVGLQITAALSHLPLIGQFMALNTATVTELVGFGALVGLSAFAGLVVSTIGVVASNVVENFKKNWYKQEKNLVLSLEVNDYAHSGSTYKKFKKAMPKAFFSPRETFSMNSEQSEKVRHVFINSKQKVADEVKALGEVPEEFSDEYSSSFSFN
jgi:hypothetical protein